MRYGINIELAGKYFSMIGILSFLVLAACGKSSPVIDDPDPDPKDAILLSLSVKKMPDKTGYFIDESFSGTGLLIEGRYDNGQTYPIAFEKLSFSGFDSGKAAKNKVVKVGYLNLSVDIAVEIYPFRANGQEITNYVEDDGDVIIPSGVTKIKADAFMGKRLKNVSFPESLLEIGDYAFFSCPNLTGVILPASLSELGNGAFDNCGALASADLSKTKLTVISEYAFSRCPVLSEINLPESITAIEALAFNGAIGLKNMVIPLNTRFIGLDAFRESGLETVKLPNNLKVIRQRAFMSCTSLSEVSVYGVYSPVDDGLIPILESSSFEDLPSLKTFEIPQGIDFLDQTILSGCPLLSEITIPATVKNIKFYAFINTDIKRVVMLSSVPAGAVYSTGGAVWNPFPVDVIIKVPAGASDKYKQAPGWSEYAGNIQPF